MWQRSLRLAVPTSTAPTSGWPLFDENALATAGRDGGRTPQSFAYEGTSRLMRERTGRLELVRSLTPHGHAPASECPKIRRSKKSECFVQPVHTKLSRFDNSLAHLLRC